MAISSPARAEKAISLYGDMLYRLCLITADSYEVLFDFDRLPPASVQVFSLPIREADEPDAEWTDVTSHFRKNHKSRIFCIQPGYIYQVNATWAFNWAEEIGSASYAFRVVKAAEE